MEPESKGGKVLDPEGGRQVPVVMGLRGEYQSVTTNAPADSDNSMSLGGTDFKSQHLTNHESPMEAINFQLPQMFSPQLSQDMQSTTSCHQITRIPLATQIADTTASTNILNSIFSCSTALDPLSIVSSLRRDLYGMPSTVQRLVMEKRLKEHQGCVNCINFSWQGDVLASSGDDSRVVQWDWQRGRVVSQFDSGHVANVFQVRGMRGRG